MNGPRLTFIGKCHGCGGPVRRGHRGGQRKDIYCGMACRVAHAPIRQRNNIMHRLATEFDVDGEDCWIWRGAKSKAGGYGLVRLEGKMLSTHRLAYEAWFGEIPEGHIVMHRCDNPSCINPDHLTSGTHQDNCRDMMAKGRAVFAGKPHNVSSP